MTDKDRPMDLWPTPQVTTGRMSETDGLVERNPPRADRPDLPKWEETCEYQEACDDLLRYAFNTARSGFDYDWWFEQRERMFGHKGEKQARDGSVQNRITKAVSTAKARQLELVFCEEQGISEEDLHQRWEGSPPEPVGNAPREFETWRPGDAVSRSMAYRALHKLWTDTEYPAGQKTYYKRLWQLVDTYVEKG